MIASWFSYLYRLAKAHIYAYINLLLREKKTILNASLSWCDDRCSIVSLISTTKRTLRSLRTRKLIIGIHHIHFTSVLTPVQLLNF